jgi:uncharacterized protein (DUF2267 family)
MSKIRPEVLSRSVQETDVWLNELQDDLRLQTPDQAYGALRAVLHALRDRLTVDMAAHLAAQLPLMLAGIFFDGWKPSATPSKIDTPEQFLEDVRQRARGHPEIDVNHAATCVFRLLERKVSPGLVEKVAGQLPAEMQAYWRQLAA